MSDINATIAKMEAVCKSPRETIAQYEKATGKKAVGSFPPYTPEEIIHAAGFLPVGLWGGQIELNLVRSVLPVFACSLIQAVKEMEMSGKYDMLAAVVIPSVCDTLKAVGQKWSRKGVVDIQFCHPQNRRLPAAHPYLVGEYQYIREKLEAVAGEKITDEAISASIKVYNEHRAVMREFVTVAAAYPDVIDPVARHTVFKSAFFMRKEEHTKLVHELMDEVKKNQAQPWKGVKAVVSGIMLEPNSVLEAFRDLNIAIVDDDLAQESRQYRTDVAETGNPIDAMATAWQEFYGCSLAFEPEKERVPMLTRMVKDSGADAVIVAMMKFCDPEEFDFPLISKEMDKNDIPLLQIEVDQQVQSVEQVRTRLQSFVEIIAQ